MHPIQTIHIGVNNFLVGFVCVSPVQYICEVLWLLKRREMKTVVLFGAVVFVLHDNIYLLFK